MYVKIEISIKKLYKLRMMSDEQLKENGYNPESILKAILLVEDELSKLGIKPKYFSSS